MPLQPKTTGWLTLLNKSWTKSRGDSQSRFLDAETFLENTDVEPFICFDNSDSLAVDPWLRSLRGLFGPFIGLFRKFSGIFLWWNRGSPFLNISRLTWRGSCNAKYTIQFWTLLSSLCRIFWVLFVDLFVGSKKNSFSLLWFCWPQLHIMDYFHPLHLISSCLLDYQWPWSTSATLNVCNFEELVVLLNLTIM